MNLPDRILDRIAPPNRDGHALWWGTLNRYGYGVVRFEGRYWMIHRLVWVADGRELGTNDLLHHDCKIKTCTTLDHLMIVKRETHMHHHHMTHCRRGHEFIPENTYVTPDGRRQCRTCRGDFRGKETVR